MDEVRANCGLFLSGIVSRNVETLSKCALQLDEDVDYLREIEQQVEGLQSSDREDATALQQIQVIGAAIAS